MLADIGGQTMLLRVLERVRAAECFDRVLVATDDPRIEAEARSAGVEVALTPAARSGTHRAALVVGDTRAGVVVVQADQPLLDPVHLRVLVDALRDATIATLVAPLEGDPSDPARVKVELDAHGRAARFSRRVIPEQGPWLVHLGVYAFQPGLLARCAEAPISPRAAEEDLEQVAWLDAGHRIHVVEVDRCPPSVDTPADLARVRRLVGAAG